MNKKTCCGCFGAGCLIVIAAFVAGGYFGINFLYDSGKRLAADGLRESVIRLAELAFEPGERMEITDLGEDAAALIIEGKISLTDLLKEATHQLETNLHVKALLLGFARQAARSSLPQAESVASDAAPTDFALPAESPVHLKVHPEAFAAVQRVVYGMVEKKISSDQLASITAKIAEIYTEKIPGDDGKSFVTRSSRRLKKNFSAEDIASSISLLLKICDESGVTSPGKEFDAADVVKKEIIAVFTKLKKTSEP